MADTNYPLTADGGPDDLPRTLRRARAERDAQKKAEASSDEGSGGKPAFGSATTAYGESGEAGVYPAEVVAYNVPFFHLAKFYVKVVLAAVPALILLGGLIWGAAHIAQTYFPWLINMQIFIHFPNP